MAKKESKRTKELRIKYWVLKSIDWILLYAALIIYFFVAMFDDGVAVNKKVGLVASVIVALILVIFNVITRHHLRSPLWIVLIGLYVCVGYLLPMIIIIAVATVLDEFVFQPYLKKLKIRFESSKEIDIHDAEKEEAQEA